jgi:hypothetical protein
MRKFFQFFEDRNKVIAHLKKLGWLGFAFFLIKGLLWILIPYLLAKGIF